MYKIIQEYFDFKIISFLQNYTTLFNQNEPFYNIERMSFKKKNEPQKFKCNRN